MATYGSGIAPSGLTEVEMTNITRRGFCPIMPIQLYGASPLTAAFLANAAFATGGLAPINVPVQVNALTQTQWTDYNGSFNIPSNITGIDLTSFTLKAAVTPIPVPGFEAAVQDEHAIIDALAARMNDSTNNGVDAIATALINNVSNSLQPTGLPAAIDDGTIALTYGGITRATTPVWASKRYNAAGANLTQALALQYIVGTANNSGGEKPKMGVMSLATWLPLAQDIMSQTSYQMQPGQGFDTMQDGPRVAFDAITVAGVPFYADPYLPNGILYLVNTDYLSLYLHRAFNFAFTGFHSTLPNYQYGWIGLVISLLELVNVKPRASTVVSNLGYSTI